MRTLIVVLAILAIAFADGSKVVDAVGKVVGKYPYSYGAGNKDGPTKGVRDGKCDDSKVIGFDNSGLTVFGIYQGCGKAIYHGATHQYKECTKLVDFDDREPGDLIFYGTSGTDIHHVAICADDDHMFEAPGHDAHCKGILIANSTIRTRDLLPKVCRYC